MRKKVLQNSSFNSDLDKAMELFDGCHRFLKDFTTFKAVFLKLAKYFLKSVAHILTTLWLCLDHCGKKEFYGTFLHVKGF